MQALQQIRKDFDAKNFDTMMSLPEFQDVAADYVYQELCKEDNGPMKLFWNSYLEMVSIRLCFIRATRKGNWQLHLECVRGMFPCFF